MFAPVANYGVGVDICLLRRGSCEGVSEEAKQFAAQRWWRTVPEGLSVGAAHRADQTRRDRTGQRWTRPEHPLRPSDWPQATHHLGHQHHLDQASRLTRVFIFAATVTAPDAICGTAHIGHRWLGNIAISQTVPDIKGTPAGLVRGRLRLTVTHPQGRPAGPRCALARHPTALEDPIK